MMMLDAFGAIEFLSQIRLSEPIKRERVRVLRSQAYHNSEHNALAVMSPVCTHGSDGRGRNRYRNTDLTLFVTKRQIRVT